MSARRWLQVVAALALITALFPLAARAQTQFGVLTAFDAGPARDSRAPLMLAADGYLYGTTAQGGPFNRGTVFRTTSAGDFTIVHAFAGGSDDGANPQAGLIQAADGNFYGTTYQGGAFGYGTLFRMTAAGAVTVLHAFTGSDGAFPEARVFQAADGNFYGTTGRGGASNLGTIYRITSTGALTVLYSFSLGPSGWIPTAGVIQATDGNLYGTTSNGGSGGTIFQLTPAGAFAVLHSMTGSEGASRGVMQAADGHLYGTTTRTVFRLTLAGAFTPLHTFTAEEGSSGSHLDLMQPADGSLYGTTTNTVFRLTPAGAFTVVHDFRAASATDGLAPSGGVVAGADGALYGTTSSGGPANAGTLFRVDGLGTFAVLHVFTVGAEGSNPQAPVIQGSDGNFYGTTLSGGIGYGTVFRLSPGGARTILHTFTSGSDGAFPSGGLTQAADGDFYGTTTSGGASNAGTVFRVAPNGAYSIASSFTGGADGSGPRGGVVQASDGDFYGATGGGVSFAGTVFRMTAAGVRTTVYTFTGGADGVAPRARLLQGTDGNFYGMGQSFGAVTSTKLFRLTPGGVFTLLHDFPIVGAGPDSSIAAGTDSASLVQGSDGNFYGTTGYAVASGAGTVFRMTLSGDVTILYAFSDAQGRPQGITQASDGNFYGTTAGSATTGNGTVFRITPAGALTFLHSFSDADGVQPRAGLIQGTDGQLYGTTSQGGPLGGGTVFRLSLAPLLMLPAPITAEATGANGAVVAYTASAVDVSGAAVAVMCTPPSGSLFALGTTTVTCSATDAFGAQTSGSFSVTVRDTTPPSVSPQPDITVNATSPAGAVATFATTAVDAVSGPRPVTCLPASGSTFPIGVTLVQCSATDGAGNVGTAAIKVLVVAADPQLSLSFNGGPNFGPFLIGDMIVIGVSAAGAGGYHFSFTPGAVEIPGLRVLDGPPLPLGFGFPAALAGIAVANSSANTAIRVTDAAGHTTDRAISLPVVAANTDALHDLPIATLGVPYAFTFTNGNTPASMRQNNGVPNQLNAWTASGLPPGLTLDPFGRLAGTPTAAGSYTPIVMRVLRSWTDANGNLVPDCDLSILTAQDLRASGGDFCGTSSTSNVPRVVERLTVEPFAITTAAALPPGVVGTVYAPVNFAAPGCGNNCSWTALSSLPPGLGIATGGVLSGTPTAPFSGPLTIQVTGSNGTAHKVFAITVASETPQPLQIATPATIGYDALGTSVAVPLLASGGVPPYSWSIVSGTGLPPVALRGPGRARGCFVLEQATAQCTAPIPPLTADEVIGASTAPGLTYLAGRIQTTGSGAFTFTLAVTDGAGSTVTKPITWLVTPMALHPDYRALPLAGTVLATGAPYTQPLLLLGGSGHYTWANTSAMPPGLSIDSATGVVSGTPTASGSFTPSIMVTDSAGQKTLFDLPLGIATGTQPPSVSTLPATSVTSSGATLNGTVNPNGLSTTAVFDVGPTIGYGNQIAVTPAPGAGTVPVAVSAAVSGLTCNTTYHFRVAGSNGNGQTLGSDLAFMTATCPPAAPNSATLPPTNIGAVGATLNGTVNPNGTSTSAVFEYGFTASYGNQVTALPTPGSGTAAVAVSATIAGLTCNTIYHARVSAANAGGVSNGNDVVFTTAACSSSSGIVSTALDGFNPGANGQISAVVVQPDGKILVGGSFSTLGGGGGGTTARSSIGRLNADGSVDTSFDPGANGTVLALAVQPDGKILVGGSFSALGGGGTISRFSIGRLNSDGSIDATFNPGANGFVGAFALQPDGKILVGGGFSTLGGGGQGTTVRRSIGRLNADGTLDAAFDPGANSSVGAIAVQADGRIVVGGAFSTLGGGGFGTSTRIRLGRLNPDGSLDVGFNPGANNGVNAVVVQPDGKILVGGGFNGLGGGFGLTSRNFIGRLNGDGSVDPTFVPGANNIVNTVVLQPDGKIVVGGFFTTLGGGGVGTTIRNRIGRLNADGTLDSGFNPGSNSVVLATAIQPDGKIVVAGSFTALGGGTGTFARSAIGRLYADGSVDSDLNPGANGAVVALATQPDGKILVGGSFSGLGGGSGSTARSNIGRVNADGTLDASFNPGANGGVTAIVVQPDGKILVGGVFTAIGGGTGTTSRNRLARLNADGSVDTSFNPGANAQVNAIALQADGKILVGGSFTLLGGGGAGTTTRNRIGRLNADGSIDQSFDPGANSTVWTLAVQPNGRILVGGSFTGLGGGTGAVSRNFIGRLNADGSLDTSFSASANSGVFALTLQGDGRIVVGGGFTTLAGSGSGAFTRNFIARLNGDGSLDTGFNPGANSSIFYSAVQTDGRILLAGPFTALGGGTGTTTRNRIGRLNPDGSLDTGFNPGANGDVYGLAQQADGKIIVGGNFTGLGGGTGTTARNRLGRVTNTDAALQNLNAANGGTLVTWSRSGGAPEVSRVAFDSSTDGVAYTPLGNGVRVAGGWQLTNQSLPTNQNVLIRARGVYAAGQVNGSGSVIESIRSVFVPKLSLLPASLPTGIVGFFYSVPFTTSGAVGVVTFSQTGSLPSGLTFDGGVLSGTPTQAGSFPITVTATDAASGSVAAQALTLSVVPLPTGQFSGSVVDTVTGAPIANATVRAYSLAGTVLGTALTDATGHYQTPALFFGTYVTKASAPGYVDEIYREIDCNAACNVANGTQIQVPPSGMVPAIDFSLTPVGGVGIAGNVTTADGPLVAARIEVSTTSGDPVASVPSNNAGHYAATELAPGLYMARTTNAAGYADRLYNNIACAVGCAVTTGTRITVAVGAIATVDFALPYNTPQGASVLVQPRDPATWTTPLTLTLAQVSAAGRTTLTVSSDPPPMGLPLPGDYSPGAPLKFFNVTTTASVTSPITACVSYVGTTFGDPNVRLLAFEAGAWVDHTNSVNPIAQLVCATNAGLWPLVLASSPSAAPLPPVLSSPAGGTILTTPVVLFAGAGLPGALVALFDSGNPIGTTSVDTSGRFSVNVTLPHGSHTVTATQSVASGTSSASSPVAFSIVPPPPVILSPTSLTTITSGTVTVSGIGVAGAVVTIRDGAATVGTVTVTSGQTFALPIVLALGTHSLTATQTADGIASASSAAVVVTIVAAGTAGRFEGIVTEAVSGLPIPNATVIAYSLAGTPLVSTTTDASGRYLTPSLASASYVAKASAGPGYVDELYRELTCVTGCNVSVGTRITVTAGLTTPNIDFTISPLAVIAGTVIGSAGTPVPDVTVSVFDANALLVKTGSSNAAGQYAITGLQGGTYYAKAANPGFTEVLYDGLACAVGCTITAGTRITGTLGGTTTANFRVPDAAEPRVLPTIRWTAPAAITYGTPLGAGQLNATALIPGTFSYTPGPGTILNAGDAQILTVTFTPSDLVSYRPATATVSINVSRLTPLIAWGNPAPITVGTPLGPAQLNAVVNAAGALVYSPPAGSMLPIGNGQTLSVAFTPADPVNVNATFRLVSINVTAGPPATPVITWPKPAPILSGTPLTAVQLNATANTPGSFVYSPPAGTVLTAGLRQVLTVAFTPTNQQFIAVQASVLIDVLAAPTGQFAGRVTDAITGSAVPGATVTAYNSLGSPVASVTANNIGLYAMTPLPTAFYTAKASAGTGFVDEIYRELSCVVGCNPVAGTRISVPANLTTANVDFTLSPLASITGTVRAADNSPIAAVSVAVFDAAGVARTTASTGPDGRYAATGLATGLYYARTTNTAGYADVLYDAIDCAVGCSITSGSPISTTVGLAATANFRLADNTQPGINVLVRPRDPASGTTPVAITFASVATAGRTTLTRSPDVPLLPAPYQLGSPPVYFDAATTATVGPPFALCISYADSVFNDDARVRLLRASGGTWVDITTSLLRADRVVCGDTPELSTFAVAEVIPIAPVLTWPTPSDITYGTALDATQLNATADTAGTFAYSPAAGAVLGAGVQQLSVTFTPDDVLHYKVSSASVSITVSKRRPTLTWATPAPIFAGTPLGAAQLNATADVAGSFVYSPASGTVLAVGNGQVLSVTFAPDDSANYLTASASVVIDVVVPLLPNLVVSSIDVPSHAQTDAAFDVSWSVANVGNKRADGPWVDKVYLSTDDLLGADVLLGTFPFSQSLDVGQSVTRTQEITIPRELVPADGQYFLIVVTDVNNDVHESDETGNQRSAAIALQRAELADLVVANIEAPATAFFDQTISVRWTVRNVGNASTDSAGWQDRVLLSPDQAGNTPSTQVAAANVSYLAHGEGYTATADLHIPRGVFGSQYIVVKTDTGNSVVEFNETNNALDVAIDIQVPPLPDLQVTLVQASDEVFAGESMLLNWRIANQGTGATPQDQSAWVDQIYLSRSQTLAGARLVGTRQRSGVLAAGQEYAVSGFGITVPRDIDGDWFVFVVADGQGQIYEFANDNNNSGFDSRRATRVHATPPDLIVTHIDAPATGVSGEQVTVHWSVKNQGAFEASSGWFDTVYLSTDGTANPATAAPVAAVFHNGGLAPGATYAASASVIAPFCTSGSYFLFVRTDSRNSVFEFDPTFDAEANNVSPAGPIQLSSNPPDLQVTAVRNTAAGTPGQLVSVTWTVANRGINPTTLGVWVDRVYLSTSPIFANGGSLILLGAFVHTGDLAVNGEYTRTEAMLIPQSANGAYSVFVVTDVNNGVQECAGESNNAVASPVLLQVNGVTQLRPDLVVTGVDVPGNLLAGQTVTVHWTVKNAGAGAVTVPPWNDGVFFSTSSSGGAEDIPLANVLIHAPLAAGATYSGQASVTAPVVPTGGFLVFKADVDNFVDEGPNEGNNTAAGAVPVDLPDVDLQIVSVAAPAAAFSGQTISVSWTVKNGGAGDTFASQWTDTLFLSRDRILDTTDRAIGSRSHTGSLAAGASYTSTLDAGLPSGLAGPYYVLLRVDARNQVVEANETNNSEASATATALALSPPVNLTVASVEPPATASPGQETTIRWTLVNQGPNVAMGEWTDAVYLSKDLVWDSDDTLIGRHLQQGPVGVGQSYVAVLTAILPAVEPGDYYVIARADVRNNVRESDEGDNAGVSLATVAIDVPELSLGTSFAGTLSSAQELHHKVRVPGDETLLYRLDVDDQNGATELFAREGTTASRSAFDYLFGHPGAADQEIVVPNTKPGLYFDLVRGVELAADTPFTLRAEVLTAGVRAVRPVVSGDGAETIVEISGAKLSGATAVSLQRGTTIVPATGFFALDASKINARFPTVGLENGAWDVVVTTDQEVLRGASAVQIEPGSSPRLSVALGLPAGARVGRSFSAPLVVRNPTNVNVERALVLLQVPASAQIRVDSDRLPGSSASTPDPSLDAFIDDEGHRVVPLYVYNVGPGQERVVNVDVTLTQDGPQAVSVETIVLEREAFQDTQVYAVREGVAKGWIETIPFSSSPSDSPAPVSGPGAACAGKESEPECAIVLEQEARNDFLKAITGLIVDGQKASLKLGLRNLGGFKDLYNFVKHAIDAIEKGRKWRERKEQIVIGSRPKDPNDKIGPAGFGAEKLVVRETPLSYTIDFENVATASAAAGRVRITDQLDPSLDARTLRLREIGFGKYRVAVPGGRAFYQGRLQLGEELGNIVADMTAGVELATRQVTWTLTAIDPKTGEQPLDALLGLLPPNDATGRGQGFVSYTVQPKSDMPTGTVIANGATIVFDTEEPIVTNTMTNTLDADAPSSAVTPLPVTSPPTFIVSWTGDDPAGGSGLQNFDVFVSDNDGPYQLFLAATTETSATFGGVQGHTYRFYSVARDNAGNVEAAPTVPDAVTSTASRTPLISWPTPADITAGTPLGDAQLNATANVPGVFVYTPAPGTILPVGDGQTLSVSFTPADTVNYDPATASVTINVRPAPLSVAVLFPNGGETLFASSPYRIRWSASGGTPGPSSFDVAVSADGSAYRDVPGCTGLGGAERSCLWSAPAPVSGIIAIRVTARDAAGHSVFDVSDGNIAITKASPAIRVTAPNTAVSWAAGTVRTITWTHNLGSHSFVRLDFSRDGGATWEPLVPSLQNTTSTAGSFIWVTTGPLTTRALIRVTGNDVPVSDTGDVSFAIVGPAVSVTSPNGSGSLRIGSTQNITFTHNLGIGQDVDIQVSRDGGLTWSPVGVVTTTSATSGAYSWVVTEPAAARARIRASWASDPSASDLSDVDFSIAAPTVTVTSPNGSGSVLIGSTLSLKFTHNLGPGQVVNLEVSRDGGATWTAIPATPTMSPTSGFYAWVVTGPATTQARIRASWGTDPSVSDISDVNFTIR